MHCDDGWVVLYGSACSMPHIAKYTTAGVRRYVMCVQCNMTASNMSPQDPTTTHQPLNPWTCHKVTKMLLGPYSYQVPCMCPVQCTSILIQAQIHLHAVIQHMQDNFLCEPSYDTDIKGWTIGWSFSLAFIDEYTNAELHTRDKRFHSF